MSQFLAALCTYLSRLPELLRFGFVAGLGLFLDLAVAYGTSRLLDFPLVLAASLGFACGAILNYALHELWTFQSGERNLSSQRALKYAVSLGATLTVRLAAIMVLERLMAENCDLAILVVATGLSFAVNYLVSKFLVFRAVHQPATTERQMRDHDGSE